MEKLTKKQLKFLIKNNELDYAGRATYTRRIIYLSNYFEYWADEKDIAIFKLNTDTEVANIKSSMLWDYHNSPKQKLKRLLDEAN